MVYLLHFDKPLRHARHYLGYAEDVEKRLKRHRSGAGSRLLAALKRAGIEFTLVRTWEGDRKFERSLKQRKNSPDLCPVCKEEKKRKKDELRRSTEKI